MRARTVGHQFVTVRPLVPQTPDVFGDAPIVMPDNRGPGFRLRCQVTATSGMVFQAGEPGRQSDAKAFVMVRKRDVPPNAPPGWKPSSNDLFELAEGERLFVMDVQNAWPAKVSVRRKNGGFDGWRVVVTDLDPTMRAAVSYDR